MAKDLKNELDHVQFVVYYSKDTPREIGLMIETTEDLTGESFLDHLQGFIDDMRENQDIMLDKGFTPPQSEPTH